MKREIKEMGVCKIHGRWENYTGTGKCPACEYNKILPKKEIKAIIEEIDTWQFAECPTETKEPFFWRWKESQKELLAHYIYDLLKGRQNTKLS